MMISPISRNFCLISETETWPVIFKSGEKQMANVLWYNEGLFVDLPFGYVDDLTQVYDSTGNTIQYRQKIKFPPKLYYPMMEIEQATEVITKKNLVDEKDNKAKQYIENNNSTTPTSYTYYPNRMSQSASQSSFTNLRPPPKSHKKVSQKNARFKEILVMTYH